MTAPYRDDVSALQERLEGLRLQLVDLKVRTGELVELQRVQGQIEREIEELSRRLEGISTRRSLPLLESIRVASPCRADWDAMSGDDRVRFCGECQKDVFNLSGMAREEAEQLLRDRTGDVCIRMYRRADGTVLTSDCPVGVKRIRRRKVAAVAVGGGLLAAGAAMLHLHRHESVMMGAVSRIEPMPSVTATATPPAPTMSAVADPPPAPTHQNRPGGHMLMGKVAMPAHR